jgi:hypothetical protein
MGKHGIFIGTLSQSDSGDKTCNIRFLSLNSRNCIKLEVNIDECSTEERSFKGHWKKCGVRAAAGTCMKLD